MSEHDQDDLIRTWFREGPSRGPERGLEETLARLATTTQGTRRELRLPIWVPAAALLALLLAGILAIGAGFRIVRPISDASLAPTATAGATCRLETPVGGLHGLLVGTGFPPDSDVTID